MQQYKRNSFIHSIAYFEGVTQAILSFEGIIFNQPFIMNNINATRIIFLRCYFCEMIKMELVTANRLLIKECTIKNSLQMANNTICNIDILDSRLEKEISIDKSATSSLLMLGNEFPYKSDFNITYI